MKICYSFLVIGWKRLQKSFFVKKTATVPHPNRYITGAGGSGKSTSLFSLAAKVHSASLQNENPVLVMYVYSCNHLYNLGNSENCAKFLCKWFEALNNAVLENINFTKLKNILSASKNCRLDIWNNLLEVIEAENLPILFALDQWNALADLTQIPDTNPLFPFTSAGFKCGGKSTFISAVSSSFSPINSKAFVDDQRTSFSVAVEPFTRAEGLKFFKILQS